MSKFAYKKLDEPILQYDSNAYLGIVSIIQAFPIGVLLWKIFERKEKEFEYYIVDVKGAIGEKSIYEFITGGGYASLDGALIIFKIILCITIIAVIIFRYIRESKYVSWNLQVWDIVIPTVMGILQCAVVISFTTKEYWNFNGNISLLYFGGGWVYYNSFSRSSEEMSQQRYRTHFSNDRIACIVHSEVVKYFKTQRDIALQSGLLILISILLLQGSVIYFKFDYYTVQIISLFVTSTVCWSTSADIRYDEIQRNIIIEINKK